MSFLWGSQEEGQARTAAELPVRGKYRLAFALFLALNAVQIIRPSELFPEMEGWPLFNIIIIACMVCCMPALFRQLNWRYLRGQPTILAVILLPFLMVISLLVNHLKMKIPDAVNDFGKVLMYFLLLTGLVNTPQRLGKFLIATVVFIIAIAAIAELDYHGIIQVQSIQAKERVETVVDATTGDAEVVQQLYGPGIFNDPNDFSLILAAGMVLLLYGALQARGLFRRIGCLALTVIPGYAFALTRSRGGFIAFATGLCVLSVSRFGWKRSVPAVALALPVVLVLFSGRMTNVNLDEGDTAQGRMELWREGFALLKQSPIFGIGWEQYQDEVGLVAHNSYVHSFTELGLVGGITFVSLFYTPISVLRRRREDTRTPITKGEAVLERLRPALLAVLSAYAVGLCTLSKPYTMSTYIIVGVGAAYVAVLGKYRAEDVPRVNWAYCKRLAVVGMGIIILFNIFVRFF
jgi:putative inorganic carbon (hco3(-)) transporter